MQPMLNELTANRPM